jgi:hypothetical protein
MDGDGVDGAGAGGYDEQYHDDVEAIAHDVAAGVAAGEADSVAIAAIIDDTLRRRGQHAHGQPDRQRSRPPVRPGSTFGRPDRVSNLSRPQRAATGTMPDRFGKMPARRVVPAAAFAAPEPLACWWCGKEGHRIRECPGQPTPDQIREAVKNKRNERAARALTDFKRAAQDKSANRAGKLSQGQKRTMELPMAFFSQLDTEDREDVQQAADGDAQLFAALLHGSQADMADTLGEFLAAAAEASKDEPESS